MNNLVATCTQLIHHKLPFHARENVSSQMHMKVYYCIAKQIQRLRSMEFKNVELCIDAYRQAETLLKSTETMSKSQSFEHRQNNCLFRFRGVCLRASCNDNIIVEHIGQLIRQSAKSPIGGNVACFRYKFGIDVDDNVLKNVRLISRYFELNGERISQLLFQLIYKV